MLTFLAILSFLIHQPSEKQLLRDELNKADMVVVGVIDNIERAREINLLRISFNNKYNAKWYWADIDVEEPFLPKGFEVVRVRIIFPVHESESSWDKFPQFQVGDEGVFILNSHRFITEEAKEIHVMMVDRKTNYQPRERFEEIRKLYINYPPR